MNFQDCEKEVTNNGMYTVCLSIMWGTYEKGNVYEK